MRDLYAIHLDGIYSSAALAVVRAESFQQASQLFEAKHPKAIKGLSVTRIDKLSDTGPLGIVTWHGVEE